MPWKLWVAVSSLLSIDLALLIVWTAVDPLLRQVHNFQKEPSQDPEDDVEIQPQLEHCKSQHHTVWLGKSPPLCVHYMQHCAWQHVYSST